MIKHFASNDQAIDLQAMHILYKSKAVIKHYSKYFKGEKTKTL